MPKIIFWNIQRQGGSVGAKGAEELAIDLFSLAEIHKPDILVICEGLKGLHKAMVGNKEVPPGYQAPKMNKQLGTYTDKNTLRYVMMHRDTIAANGYLISTGEDRPAMVITWGGYSVMALHAPSVTASTVPQTKQMLGAFNKWCTSNAIYGTVPTIAPQIIFGDLNMDASNPTKRDRIFAKFLKTDLENYSIRAPQQGTHRNNKTRIYDTTLDWAFCAPGITATVTALLSNELQKRGRPKTQTLVASNDRARSRSRYNDKKKPQQKQKRKISYDSDSEPESDRSDDEDYEIQFENQRMPDHLPILIEW